MARGLRVQTRAGCIAANVRIVNPMSIEVPKERQLDGKELAAFQRERNRIEELMRRPPVVTKTASRTQ